MNILTICVLLFILIMIIVSVRRGLVKTALSLGTFVLTMILSALLYQPLGNLVKTQTNLYTNMESGIESFVEEHVKKGTAGIEDGVQGYIKSLGLPSILTSSILQDSKESSLNGTSSAAKITEFLTGWLTDLAFQIVMYIATIIVVAVLIKIAQLILLALVQLPVLKQLDKLAGGVLGFLMSIVLIWVGCLIVTLFASSEWGSGLMKQIQESSILLSFYNSNPLMKFLL